MPRVGIVGVGLVGRAWANVFARSGWDVAIYDADDATLQAAPSLIGDALQNLAGHGLVEDPIAAANRITTATSLEAAVDGVELVQESGPEKVDAKIALFKQLDRATPRSAILASSSSAIVASRFTEDLEGRDRCMIAHPVNPPHLVPIVELCGSPWTSQDMIARAREIYDSVGQVTIEVKKEIDGFILNRLQAVLLSEALRLVRGGYCSSKDLDKTIAHGLGLRWSFMGPFETIELNAPGGIADYCERFGPSFYGLSSAEVTPELWSNQGVQELVEDWGSTPSPDEIQRKSRWRDDRLAALVAHKKAQNSYE